MTNFRRAWLSRFRAPALGVQLLLGLVLATALVSLAAGLIVRGSERSYLAALLTAESKRKFDLLVFATTDDVVSADIPRLRTTMEELLKSDAALDSARITDEDGHVLFDWSRARISGHPKLLSFSREVRVRGELFGTFAAAWDLSELGRNLDRHTYTVAGAIGAVCLTLSLLIYLLMSRLAVLPIGRIAEHVADFREGVFNRVTRLPFFTPKELRHLDESVNMLGELLARQEQRDAEREAARAAAVAANRSKSEFLARVTHDLRTPLNAILGFSDSMQLEIFGPIGNAKYKEYVGHINMSGTHLLALINDILDISKIEFGKMSLDETEVNLQQAIQSSLVLMRPHAREGRVRLVENLPAKLPRVRADEHKLKEVLLNLLSNGVKFTPFGGSVTVAARLDRASGIVIEVTDTGIGIPPDQIDRALEPFGQVESAYTRRHKGTGLGLPLAKALVELHGGVFELASQVGVGTRVSFTLPPARILSGPVAEIVEIGAFRASQR